MKELWMRKPRSTMPKAGYCAFWFCAVVQDWPFLVAVVLVCIAHYRHGSYGWAGIMWIPILLGGAFATRLWIRLLKKMGLWDKYHLDGRRWDWGQ